MTNNQKWYRQKKHYIAKQYRNIKMRHRSHMLEEYPHTLEEYREYVGSSKAFNYLFKKWEMSDYKKNLAPSPNRIDEDAGYEFNNIEFMTFEMNMTKQKDLQKKGLGSSAHRNKEVLQYTKDNKFVKKHISISNAAREIDGNATGIQAVLAGRYNTYYGYIWKYS